MTLPKLGYSCTKIGSGKTPLGGAEVYVTEGVTFLRSQNVYDDGLRLDDVVKIDPAVDAEMAISRVKPGDVLFNITGASIGRCCLVPTTLGPANVNQHVCIIRPADNRYGPYFAYALQSPELQSQISASLTGAARDGVTFEQLSNLRFTLPTPAEAQGIAGFLDRETAQIDELIGKQERLIELLAERRQAIITQAVTKGLDPTAPTKPSGIPWLGNMPTRWGSSRMSYEVWVRARLGWKGLKAEEYIADGIAFLSTPNIKGRRIDLTNVNRITPLRFEESPEIKLSVGDVVLAKDGSTLGTVNVVRALPEPMTVNSSIAVLTPSPSVDGVYLYYLLQADFLSNTIQLLKGGMGVPHLFQDDIRRFGIPIPPAAEQQAISTYLDEKTDELDLIITKVQATVDLLQERRSALISAAVTGKIDVREGAA
ncbi:restriction endonuclease subunit S [Arthrobacter sp. W4I7]|uniref:restriction endonuclease subunit S n=1 Tax=Arthrobacter sp. W4I7 TaxID=3042296 RepID=UPI0027835629|nr:restriction endonuclease subunit S [Arthrobacter sp. W4I7]MDQ0692146.1 type I restriction enzyme S subunit [Arthrobacter sp. W4I7]